MRSFRAIIFLFLFTVSAGAATWFVPDSIPDIQSAVNVASSGDTILVMRAFQNAGSVVIKDKKIILLADAYMKNPGGHNFLTGAAIYTAGDSLPLLLIESADSTVIRGFLFDRAPGGAGELAIKDSYGVLFDGVHLKGCHMNFASSSAQLKNAFHYQAQFADTPAVKLQQSTLVCHNILWRDLQVSSLLFADNGSSFRADNHVVFNNQCSGNLFNVTGAAIELSFTTFYNNASSLSAWQVATSAIDIRNSVLCHLPPNDPVQFDIRFSAVPEYYPGTGNISADPGIDLSSSYPKLHPYSPCVAAGDPDTSGIPRFDFSGDPRPNPVWSPPDMGAFESPRHVPLNTDSRFWVDPLGNDTWGNGSFDLPYLSVQSAVNSALAGDTVIIRPGSYRGNVTLQNKPLTIASTFLINGDSAMIPATVLLGDTLEQAPVLRVNQTDSLNLWGLTISEGNGRYFYNRYTFGGGLYAEKSKCLIRHSVFSNNSADFNGGGLYAIESNITLDHVLFGHNTAYLGGGLGFSNTTVRMSNILVRGNTASSGGGIYAENNSKLVVFYADISNNYANNDSLSSRLSKPASVSQYGGGLFATTGSDIRLHNVLLSQNQAINKGAAIATIGGQVEIIQSTIADHESGTDSSGVLFFRDQPGSSTILNTNIWNPGEIQIECLDGRLVLVHTNLLGGPNNILHPSAPADITTVSVLDTDPGFDISYELGPASPCRDAGIFSYVSGGYYLINYTSEHYSGTAPDIGHLGASPPVRFSKESLPVSVASVSEQHDKLRAFPNPFNPDTRLSFRLSEPGIVVIDVFDLRGYRVKTLLNKYLQEGDHALVFNAGDLPAGLYLCLLHRQGKILASQKLILLK